ncbi:MAG: hypothetical protein A2Y14_03545 [Verrucomicrobia bacterium GWF2_51_19]|nr:MAG: hypothetical protein A2Y14_03545 [Verrucomicrobia bacterium GWF2_51_19]
MGEAGGQTVSLETRFSGLLPNEKWLDREENAVDVFARVFYWQFLLPDAPHRAICVFFNSSVISSASKNPHFRIDAAVGLFGDIYRGLE